jgi:ribosome-associated protein
MEDIASAEDRHDVRGAAAKAMDIARLIDEHKGRDTIVLDMRGLNSWTDFFILSTVTSSTHLKGLLKHIKDGALGLGIELLRKHSGSDSDEWSFVDLGDIVIHLMTERTRDFYELERLWHQAKVAYRSVGAPAQNT